MKGRQNKYLYFIIIIIAIINLILLFHYYKNNAKLNILYKENANLLYHKKSLKKMIDNYYLTLYCDASDTAKYFFMDNMCKEINSDCKLYIRLSSRQCNTCVRKFLTHISKNYSKEDIGKICVIVDDMYAYLKRELIGMGFNGKNIEINNNLIFNIDSVNSPYIFTYDNNHSSNFFIIDRDNLHFADRYLNIVLKRKSKL